MPPLHDDVSPRPILIAGDPRLRERSVEVAVIDEALFGDASALCSTLQAFRERNGFGRAISAIQIGIAKRLIGMDLGAGPFILVNPEITRRSEETFLVWDDCLSVPDIIVRVRRHSSISIRYRDERFHERHWNDLPPDLAELLQHEMDHLNGVLMTDLAEGADAVQPLSRWAELVGAARPAGDASTPLFPPLG